MAGSDVAPKWRSLSPVGGFVGLIAVMPTYLLRRFARANACSFSFLFQVVIIVSLERRGGTLQNLPSFLSRNRTAHKQSPWFGRKLTHRVFVNRNFALAILIGALGVAAVSGPWGAASLERRLLEKSTGALAAAGHDWAKVAMDGQVVNISGVAPSPEAVRDARRVTLAADGPGGRIIGGVTKVSTDEVTILAPLAAAPTMPTSDPVSQRPPAPETANGDANPVVAAQEESATQTAAPPPTASAASQCQDAIDAAVDTGRIVFRLNSYSLSVGDRQLLDRVAAQLRDCRGVRLVVEGHTDNRGAQSANLALSRRRAGAVRDYLAQTAGDDVAIIVSAFGESQPIAPNTSLAGRKANRRIEFVVETAGDQQESD